MQGIITQLTFLIVSFTLAFPLAADVQHPDKLIAKKKITGRIVYFDQGDYLYVTVRGQDGTNVSFLLGNETCFLAEHRDHTLEIEYHQIEHYFPEGNGYYPANSMQAIVIPDTKDKWDVTKNTRPDSKKELACIRVLERLPSTPTDK